MSNLLIVESPGKIKKITEYLGNDYIVSASIGHIIDLNEKSMSIDLDTFIPEYFIYDNKKDVVDKLKKLVNKVGKENVLLAADEDREGEMIAWSLARELKLTKPKRIVFNSITEKELKNAISNPKIIDQNMVFAQQARRILDRLAGYLISPILYKSGFKDAKSAGRVQSVVVKIIVDKEKEIEEFYKQKKDTYFYINCYIKINEHELTTKLYKKNIKINDQNIENSDELENNTIKNKKDNNVDNISNKSYVTFNKLEEKNVIKIIKAMVKGKYLLFNKIEKVRKTNSPPPFTTSTLQQISSKKYNIDTKRTMSIAQKLYEAGHITYMRTDSTSISDEAKKSIKNVIESEYGIEYYEKHDYINKKANTQEAHECIRPTKPQYSTIDGSSDEKLLYNLIWKRTIQSQMKAAQYQSILIEIEIKEKKNILEDYKLVGTLENLIYEGYLIVDGKKKSTALDIKALNNIDWLEINGIEDTEKPPIRYNDASLINKMDPKNLNIGRPSTYASFIEKIQQRLYVEIKDIEGKKIQVNMYNVKKDNIDTINIETKNITIGKEKNKLVPTELGYNITNFLENNFKILMDYQFTAKMETELDDIAEGTLNNIIVIKKFYEYIQSCIEKIVPNKINISDTIILGNINSEEIKLMNGQYGKYIVYGKNKFNLKLLCNELNIDENQIESNNKLICDLIVKKNNSFKIWTIKSMKYVLKKGKFGYYIEEISIKTNKKKSNYSIKYLIEKIAKDNNIICNEDNAEKIINLITNDNIVETINYYKNKLDKK
jgi:DNA topoisomerase-1